MVKILGECLTGDAPSTDDVRSLRGFVKFFSCGAFCCTCFQKNRGWVGDVWTIRVFFADFWISLTRQDP